MPSDSQLTRFSWFVLDLEGETRSTEQFLWLLLLRIPADKIRFEVFFEIFSRTVPYKGARLGAGLWNDE